VLSKTTDEAETLHKDRALLLRLLELADQDDVEPFLHELLDLLIDACEAKQGYIELSDHQLVEAGPHFSLVRGLTTSETEQVRGFISRGIIAETLATGEVVDTVATQDDERFRDRESVREHSNCAVICAPLGTPPVGVVYLQGAVKGDFFSPVALARVELFSRRVGPLARRVIAHAREHLAVDPTRALRQRLKLDRLVGRSQIFARVLEDVAVAANVDTSVLLTGPTGTGKTALAWAIHENSCRSHCPFVALNCANFPEALVESELFGVERGAHSTAMHAAMGKIAAAQSGTLFLDELAELNLAAQAKLLTFLDSGEYYRLGSNKPRAADVRLIAATNAVLKDAVREGRFREDLWYRIGVLTIPVPALDDRREDIRLLAPNLIEDVCKQRKLPRLQFSPASLLALERTAWPGNIRDLRNAIERGAIRAAGERGEQIEPRHLFRDAHESQEPRNRLSWQEAKRCFEKECLRQRLDEFDWNVAKTAVSLDLSKQQVYNLIHAFFPRETP
jgi:Nif-specific regulatory protein